MVWYAAESEALFEIAFGFHGRSFIIFGAHLFSRITNWEIETHFVFFAQNAMRAKIKLMIVALTAVITTLIMLTVMMAMMIKSKKRRR